MSKKTKENIEGALLAIIVFIFMAASYMTGIYIFVQIAVTVALINFMVSIIRRYYDGRLK